MKPSDRIFFIAVLSVFYFCDTSHAIYDPRETHGVKPPRHRELGIPWYLSSATSAPPIDTQISEWDPSVDSTPRNPVIVHDGAHSHRHDYQTSDGVIEQQSVTSFDNNYEQAQDTRENFDFQQYSDQNYAENGWFIDNDDSQKPYEDFASEIKKPYKDTKDFTTEPVESMKVARYDSATGAHCPTSDATGQFVYPPDCKFFVNCWNGRAFVQPCAPGTLFNPETLECDYPIKVQCYGTELRDLTGTRNVPPPIKTQPLLTGSQTEWRVESPNNNPTCPPWITGLLPHPNDCTKFLQCANGGTFIMNCGPGTVFNPEISVCDWPYNVRGCEDALRPKLEITTAPMRENFDVRGSFREGISRLPVQSNTVACLDGQEGLFRHPSDCTKFLQCNHGNTHVMNCGPGTVFNPSISSCDFPYNVAGCGEAQPTVTESTQSGTDSYNQNLWGQNTFVQRGQSQTENDRTTYPTNIPNVPTAQNFHTGQDYEHSNQNYNQHSHGTNYPNTNWHQYPNNRNYGQPTGSSYHILPNRNWNTYHEQNNNNHDSEGSYSNVPRTTIRPHTHFTSQNTYVDSSYRLPNEDESTNRREDFGRELPVTNPVWNYGQPPTTTENIIHQHRWNQPESNISQPGRFVPSTWRGQDELNERPSIPAVERPWLRGTINPNNQMATDRELDSKLDHWAMKTNLFHQGGVKSGTKSVRQGKNFSVKSSTKKYNQNSTTVRNENLFPNGIYVNANGIRGHFITKEIEINQGHSNTRQYGNQNGVDTLNVLNRHPGSMPSYQIPVAQSTDTVPKQANHQFTRQYGNQNGVDTLNVPNRHPGLMPSYQIPVAQSTDTVPKQANHQFTRQYGNQNGVNTLDVPNRHPGLTPFYQNPMAQSTDTVPKQQNHQFVYRESDPKFVVPTSNNSYTLTEKCDLPPVNTKNFRPNTQNNLQKIPSKKEINHNLDETHIRCKNGQRNCIFVNNPTKDDRKYHTSDRNTSYIAIEFGDDHNDEHKISNKTNIKNTAQNSSILVEGGTLEGDSKDVTNDRKPKLIFENKTVEDSKTSTIMKINKENIDLDLFGVDLIHDKEEPPFPVYYVPPVEPINYVPELVVQISPISGQMLRLRGGSVLGEGYLEVQGAQPGWGIVCDLRHEWTLIEANVVCRQLGYTRGADMAWQGKNNPGETPSWIAADSVHCVGNETYFQSCEFTYNSYCDVAQDAVGIRCLPNRVAYCREDEIPHRGFCYHLANPDTALNHAEALGYCNNKKSKLLDIIDQNENNFVSEWLVQSHPDVNSVMTSGFGFTTLGRTLWLWEDSQHAKFRFNKWWPGWMSDKSTPPSVGTRPACIVMKRNFPCHNRPDESCRSDYFFWDTEDCAASSRGHSYVCKRAYNDIGCVYGKGQHYSGTANVTASGTICLSWGDESVEQYLDVKVNSEEIRNKLREHNYCRNPNPNREIKPWCFTGSNGEFDYCDIPPCAKQGTKKSIAAGQCKPKHFECTPGECIPSPWICDGEEDCTNGADEHACFQHLEIYTKIEQHRLEDYDVEKWLNTPLKTCALRCKEADFTCRSFSHKALGNICLLSDSNIGLTGSLQPSEEYDYYEMKEKSLNCSDMFVCGNQKCINQSLVCDGKNNCGDRSDENICDLQNLGYEIRLSGSNNTGEGKVEVKAWGRWGQVCDDGFGMIAASIVCKELGFTFGAREIRPSAFYSKGGAATFLMDQVKCRGNETSLRECDFDGWGVHNCLPDEAVGIVCKTAVNTCQDGFWKCDNSPECIPTPFICDEVVDCGDGSDEGPEHCEAPFELRLSEGSSPLEGRVEVRHHGIWGTVCDDDFSKETATVICKSLGYGGSATALKNGAFGPGEGPIWLDEVYCYGNETQLYKCDHEPWGRHNCGHDEDAGVRCEPGEVIVDELPAESVPYLPEITVNNILPADCGMRVEDFDENDEYMARVVQGSIAPKGAYPWQASLRVRGHSRSSHWCGAVVISPRYVLTAAHCLEGYNKGMYFVRAGDFNTEIDDGTEVEANIEDYYIHEDFRKGQRMNNDIALVLLKGRGIPLGRNIMPICLPPENIEYLPGLNCTISGWGSIESGRSVQSNFLRFGWVPILDQSICRADYVYGEGAISDGMVCAGYLNEGVDSCDGDSGGPLACYHNNAFTLYGLTSWGKHCGAPNKPGVYVRLAHYRRWIDQKIQESSAGR